jgi:hypothetical protein
MPKLTRFTFLVVALGLAILACSLPFNTAPTADPGPVFTAAAQTIVAAASLTSVPSITPLQPAAPTTPAETSTPTDTPSPTSTATPSIVTISVTVDTNCRSGPGKVYDYLGGLFVGETAEVLGKSSSGNYWYIRLPKNPGTFCWVTGEYATVNGDTAILPVFTPAPTPTPAAAFTFSYRNLGVGPGYQCLLFDVKNTGSVIWESFRLESQNNTQGVGGTTARDDFTNYDQWCASTGGPASLTSGSSGTAYSIVTMPGNPSGNSGTAILTLCSQNGLAGQCLTQTINFSFP